MHTSTLQVCRSPSVCASLGFFWGHVHCFWCDTISGFVSDVVAISAWHAGNFLKHGNNPKIWFMTKNAFSMIKNMPNWSSALRCFRPLSRTCRLLIVFLKLPSVIQHPCIDGNRKITCCLVLLCADWALAVNKDASSRYHHPMRQVRFVMFLFLEHPYTRSWYFQGLTTYIMRSLGVSTETLSYQRIKQSPRDKGPRWYITREFFNVRCRV